MMCAPAGRFEARRRRPGPEPVTNARSRGDSGDRQHHHTIRVYGSCCGGQLAARSTASTVTGVLRNTSTTSGRTGWMPLSRSRRAATHRSDRIRASGRGCQCCATIRSSRHRTSVRTSTSICSASPPPRGRCSIATRRRAPSHLFQLSVAALIVPGRDASHATSAARYLEECLPNAQYWDVPVEEQTERNAPERLLTFLNSVERLTAEKTEKT